MNQLVAILFLLPSLALGDTITAHLFQDFEGGTEGQVVTVSILNAGSHGAATGNGWDTWNLPNDQTSAAIPTATITATASDLAGNTASDVITITRQEVAPTVSITSPANDANVIASAVAFSGTAYDDVNLVSVGLTNITSATGFTVTGITSWTSTAEMVFGVNTVEAVATDAAGNHATNSVNVIYVPITGATATVGRLRIGP